VIDIRDSIARASGKYNMIDKLQARQRQASITRRKQYEDEEGKPHTGSDWEAYMAKVEKQK
jgi:hypothetical protein